MCPVRQVRQEMSAALRDIMALDGLAPLVVGFVSRLAAERLPQLGTAWAALQAVGSGGPAGAAAAAGAAQARLECVLYAANVVLGRCVHACVCARVGA